MKKILTYGIIVSAIAMTASCSNTATVLDETVADGFVIEQPTEEPIKTLEPEKRDFRALKWGMSLSDVTQNEGEGYSMVKQGVIRYNSLKIDDIPVEAEYTFENDKLSSCIYYSTNMHQKTEEYITEYKKLIEKYKSKYGAYKYSEEKWAEDVDKSKTDSTEALENGMMMYRTGWEKGNTAINLVLFRDNDSKIKIGIRYTPIDITKEGEVEPMLNGDSDI